MKILETSWHRKLYNLTYPKRAPNNLCPYFWLSFLAFVVFPFNFLFSLPAKIICAAQDKWEWDIFKEKGDRQYWKGAFLAQSWFSNVALYLTFCMVAVWWNKVWMIGAIIGAIVVAGILFILFYGWMEDRRIEARDKRQSLGKEKRPNVLVEFIKAKYSKYCLQIEWTKKQK